MSSRAKPRWQTVCATVMAGIAITVINSFHATHANAQVIDLNTGDEISEQALAERLRAQDIVLLGEGEGTQDLTGLKDLSGLAEIVLYTPENVVVRTDAPQDSLLLLTDADYPGWQAALDGQPAAIIPADGLFRGVMVPAGEHEVAFTFASQSLANGRALSLVGVALLLLAGGYWTAVWFWRKRIERLNS